MSLTKVVIGKVRLSFAHIWEKHAAFEGQEPKYSVSLIIPKTDTVTLDKIRKAIEAAKTEGVTKLGGKIPPNLKTPLRDGDIDRPDDEAYAGCYFLNASSNSKPAVVDKQVQPILDPEEVVSGDYANVSINFYAYNANGNKGIAAGLGNVQFLEKGEALSGKSSASDDFEAIADDLSMLS